MDPLDLEHLRQVGKVTRNTRIDVHEYFTAEDLDREFYIFDEKSTGIVNDKKRPIWRLRDLVAYLEKAYCGKISYEYMHIDNATERDWIRAEIENYDEFMPSRDQRIKTYERYRAAKLSIGSRKSTRLASSCRKNSTLPSDSEWRGLTQ